MREIKFRAWDEDEKEFYYSDLTCWKNQHGYIFDAYSSKHADFFDGWGSGEKVKDLKLEQYTGLKDKNGKEIYEGDICLFDGNYKYPVRFDEGCFCTDAWSDFDPLFRCKDIEIIGNIHEETK